MAYGLKHSRPGYTLLEVLVASAVGVLLMGALYMAISVQLRHAQIGRELVEQSLLARTLLARIDNDIRSSLGPPAPAKSSSSSSAGGSSAAGGSASGSSGTAGAAGSGSSTGASSTGSGTSSGSNPSTTTGTGAVQFNLWVQGGTDTLMLYVSRVPRELNPIPGSDNNDVQPLVSDLRRVSYWLAGGGSGNPLGLARQEVTMVTSDQAMADVPPGIANEESMVIAEEVKSLTFSYFDGSSWQDTWDGTTAGSDGTTPVGPPMLIAITIGIAAPPSGNPSSADAPTAPLHS